LAREGQYRFICVVNRDVNQSWDPMAGIRTFQAAL